jgi:peptidoglycan/LPS O-acetylase OafA/YrhL
MAVPLLPTAWTLSFEMLFYAAVTSVLADRRLLLAVVGVFAVAATLRTRGPIFFGVPAAMIVLGTMQVDAKPSVWTFLGDASYTLYLTHKLPLVLLLVVLWWSAHSVAPALIIVMGSSLSLLFAWRVHVLFEIPLLQWLGRRSRRSSLGEPLRGRAASG